MRDWQAGCRSKKKTRTAQQYSTPPEFSLSTGGEQRQTKLHPPEASRCCDDLGLLAFSMNSLSGLVDLLKKLASHNQNREKTSCQIYNSLQNMCGLPSCSEEGSLLDPQTCHLNISILNQSLKFNQRAPLLDAALSVMGYQVPDICDTTTSFLMNTLISALLSTISCKILSQPSCAVIKKSEDYANASLGLFSLRGQDHMATVMIDANFNQEQGLWGMEQFLQIGTVISANEYTKIVEACEYIFRNMEAYGNLSTKLIDALLRVATSISCFKGHFSSSSACYTKLKKEKTNKFPKLINILIKRIELADWNFNSSIRLLAWRLEPHLLKHDVSSFLREALERPLLSLKHELYSREIWHSIIVSLATAPEIFAEARCLLHNWFLQTGSDRVLEVRFELFSAMLDVLISPSSWGMPIEAGHKLPSLYAFFCQSLQPLLVILMGPLSYSNLLTLVHWLEEMQSLEVLGLPSCLTTSILGGSHGSAAGALLPPEKPSERSLLVDHNSVWALLLDFPFWFHFAAMLLFQPETSEHGMQVYDTDGVHPNDIMGTVDKCTSCNSDRFQTAAKYLGWVLSPIEVGHRTLVISFLVEISRLWSFWRSRLITSLQEREGLQEETDNQLNCLGWGQEINLNKKRVLSASEGEMGDQDVKCKKAKVEPVPKKLHQSVMNAKGSEESVHAVMQWLEYFQHSCNKLYIDTVNIDSINKKAGISNRDHNCEAWRKRKAVLKEGKTAGSYQQLPLNALLKQYAFLRRIPLGLIMGNSYLLNEHACEILLHFAATGKVLATTPVFDDSNCEAIEKVSCGNSEAGQVVQMLNGSKDQKMYPYTRELAHLTEDFRYLYTVDHLNEGKTNWMSITAVILNFFPVIDMLYHTFENASDCPSLLDQIKVKVGRSLVVCIKQIMKSQDLQEPRLLKDLRCRFVDCTRLGETVTKEGETVLDATDIYHDILLALDSQISLLEAKQ